jgi:hypothetical protein
VKEEGFRMYKDQKDEQVRQEEQEQEEQEDAGDGDRIQSHGSTVADGRGIPAHL